MAGITLKTSREKSLLRKHPWIFDGAIESVQGNPHKGATVDVFDASGKWLAKGAFSPESQIRVRVWSYEPSEVIDDAFFKRRIQQAIDVRASWLAGVNSAKRTNAYRLVASESDGLPGITIDKYDNVLVMQLLSAGAQKHKTKIVKALAHLFADHVIHERSDASVLKKEGLPATVETHFGQLPDTLSIKEYDLSVLVDFVHGHKTGFYLDQRKNRRLLGQICSGKRVLNCFSYTGAFALHAVAGGAKEVINVDVSQDALALSEQNLRANFDAASCERVQHINRDVFELLREYQANGEQFDVIVMDPPKFVENKNHLVRASRGYKDLNRLACELLVTQGTLLTFSCSGLVSQDLFNKIIADAALDAKTQLAYVEKLEQDSDHLVASSFPEGSYLKGLMCVKR